MGREDGERTPETLSQMTRGMASDVDLLKYSCLDTYYMCTNKEDFDWCEYHKESEGQRKS